MKQLRCLAAAFLLTLAPLAAQEDDRARYIIETIDVSIEGRTRVDAVLRQGEFALGEELRGKTALDTYLAQKTRLLANHRSISKAEITYTLETREDNVYAARLLVTVTDTRNFIILPEPKFSSSKGFEPALKIRDYNFLGALAPLKIDLAYALDEFHLDDASKGVYSVAVESDMPFRALALDWNLSFLFSLAYTTGEPLAFSNTTGLAVLLPHKTARFTLGFEYETRLGEEYYLFEKEQHPAIFEQVRYMTARPYAQMTLPLGITTSALGELFWKPRLEVNAAIPLEGDLDFRRGPELRFTQTAGFDHVDWRGNFREGAVLLARFTNTYNAAFAAWDNHLALSGTAHHRITDFFAFSARGRYAAWLNDVGRFRDPDRLEAGNMLRGILDRSITATMMVSVNIDAPVRVLRFMPSEWFGVRQLRYFNFEMQLAPILDAAFVEGSLLDRHGVPLRKLGFNLDSLLITGGAEVLVFPLAWRSIFLRFSIGWNLREAAGGKAYEIFIGIGHHY